MIAIPVCLPSTLIPRPALSPAIGLKSPAAEQPLLGDRAHADHAIDWHFDRERRAATKGGAAGVAEARFVAARRNARRTGPVISRGITRRLGLAAKDADRGNEL